MAPTGRLPGVPIVELRSPLARAVVPVLAGAAFFAAMFGVLWLIAAWVSSDGERITNLGDRTFEVGNVETISDIVAEDGPILFPDLVSPSGVRAIVLDHKGDDPTTGWRVFYAYPADRDPTCLAEQVERTTTFVDCDERELDIEQLARPLDVRPVVENRTKLLIDLRTPTAST